MRYMWTTFYYKNTVYNDTKSEIRTKTPKHTHKLGGHRLLNIFLGPFISIYFKISYVGFILFCYKTVILIFPCSVDDLNFYTISFSIPYPFLYHILFYTISFSIPYPFQIVHKTFKMFFRKVVIFYFFVWIFFWSMYTMYTLLSPNSKVDSFADQCIYIYIYIYIYIISLMFSSRVERGSFSLWIVLQPNIYIFLPL